MNERIRELASQIDWSTDTTDGELMKFANLLIQECISTIETAENGYQDYRNQIENGMRKHCIWLIKDKFGVEQ